MTPLTPEQEAIATSASNDCVMTISANNANDAELIHPIISDAIARAVEPVEEELAMLKRANKIQVKQIQAQSEDYAQLQSRCYEGFPSASDGIFDALKEADAKLQAQSEDTETGWVLRDEICERVPWDTPSKRAWVRVRYAARKEGK